MSNNKLADALRSAGFETLAIRADLDEFDPDLSPHDLPDIMLYMELLAIIKGSASRKLREAARMIRIQHMQGGFNGHCGSGSTANSPRSFAQVQRVAMDAN